MDKKKGIIKGILVFLNWRWDRFYESSSENACFSSLTIKRGQGDLLRCSCLFFRFPGIRWDELRIKWLTWIFNPFSFFFFFGWQNSKNKSFEYKCSLNKFPENLLLQSLNKINTSDNNKLFIWIHTLDKDQYSLCKTCQYLE